MESKYICSNTAFKSSIQVLCSLYYFIFIPFHHSNRLSTWGAAGACKSDTRDCSPVADVPTSADAGSQFYRHWPFHLEQKTMPPKHLEQLCYQVYIEEYEPSVLLYLYLILQFKKKISKANLCCPGLLQITSLLHLSHIRHIYSKSVWAWNERLIQDY